MARKRLNPRLAKMHRCYAIDEIATLYSLHPNTIRHWLKAGLTAIDDAHPILVKGDELRRFIEEKRAATKQPCPPGTLFCFRCRAPRAVALGMADFLEQQNAPGILQALCTVCGTLMYRRARRDAIAALLPSVIVQVAGHQERIGE